MKRMQPVLLALPLAACASYAPHPLSDTPAMLDAPTSATLTQAAAEIARPYLAPAAIDLAAPLDPNAVATIAVIANPDLKALRAKSGVSDAQAFAARLMPDPTFSIGAHPVLSGPDPLTELVGALGLDLNALRTRGVQRRQARAQAEQARLDLAWAEWQTAGQARIQAVRILGFEKSVALERQTLAAQQNLLRHTLAALGRGDIAADRAQAARTAAYDAETRLRTDEASLATAADFARADLRGASFLDAQMVDAVLDRVDLRRDMDSGDETGSSFKGANLTRVNFSEAKMRNADLSGALLSSTNLMAADLRGANFCHAEIADALVAGAHMADTDFSGAIIAGDMGGRLDVLRMKGPEFRRLDPKDVARMVSDHAIWVKSQGNDGSRADFSCADLTAADFSGHNLCLADLSGALLAGAQLKSALLIATNFRGANLTRASLAHADLRGADFQDTHRRDIDLSNSKIGAIPGLPLATRGL